MLGPLAASFLATTLTVAEFASKPFVQRACASPMSPASVLSFFFGVDYHTPDHVDVMRRGVPLGTMQNIWYGGGDEYDTLCQPFGPVIRAVAAPMTAPSVSSMTKDVDWDGTVDGTMSQIILCDQLARNCFRWTDEAFRYDPVSERYAKHLVDMFFPSDGDLGAVWNKKEDGDDSKGGGTIPGELYPPYASFLITTLMHTEDQANLQLATRILDLSLERFQDDRDPIVGSFFQFQKQFLIDHQGVIDRFGRYPHRNSKLGRSNTPEEQAWLDDVENLPGWAKSQG